MTEAEWFSLLEERSHSIGSDVTIHNYKDIKKVSLYQQDFRVFCDWLEEQGHPLLKGFRDMAYREPPCRPFRSMIDGEDSYGWNCGLSDKENPYHLSDIPQKCCKHVGLPDNRSPFREAMLRCALAFMENKE